jgi:hypothetical protein
MLTKTTFALAFALATASGGHENSQHRREPGHRVQPRRGTDPDLNIRFELNRDWGRERN